MLALLQLLGVGIVQLVITNLYIAGQLRRYRNRIVAIAALTVIHSCSPSWRIGYFDMPATILSYIIFNITGLLITCSIDAVHAFRRIYIDSQWASFFFL